MKTQSYEIGMVGLGVMRGNLPPSSPPISRSRSPTSVWPPIPLPARPSSAKSWRSSGGPPWSSAAHRQSKDYYCTNKPKEQ
jgi:hypothetical protein